MGSSSQTTEQSIPQWQEDYLRQNVLPKATEIGSTPFTQYGGQTAADLGSYTQQAAGIYGGIAGMTPADYAAMNQANMSAYQTGVIDPALARMQRERQQQEVADQASIAQAGAFGNERRGVFEGERAAAYDVAQNELIANLTAQGYSQAQAATMAQLANQQAGAGALAGIGGQQTALQQQGLDTAYQEFLRGQNLPYQQLGALLGAGQGNYGQTQTSTKKNGLFDYLTLGATAFS